MKKSIIYSAIVLLLGVTACNKTDKATFEGDGNIRFAPATADTRALIEDDAALQAQTFQVYDFMGETKYIDETISYADSKWNYASESTYTWKAGDHKFFGYTSGAGTFASDALTVSKTLTTAEADQKDLLYSEIFSTTADAWKATEGNTIDTPVALHMKHLFAAVSITLENCTDSEASITKVTAPAIPNAGSATVSYAGDAVSVEYGTPTVSGSFVNATPISTATALASQKTIDVLTMAASDAKSYQMVWPQTLGEDAVTVTVSYTLNETTYTDKVVSLPADTWQAGKKYDYVLQILPSEVRLVFKVQPWDAGQAGEIDTKDGSINMSNVTWMNTKLILDNGVLVNTVVNSAYSVYMYYHPNLPVYDTDGNMQTTGSTYPENVYGTYPENVYKTYEEDVYQTYEENVIDEESGEVIHAAGDFVLDENGEKILLHSKGDTNYDDIIHKAGDPIYSTTPYTKFDYYPAQGYFTVNYPESGLFKIGLIPAYKETAVDEDAYEIYIYKQTGTETVIDEETGEEKEVPVFEWVLHDSTNGEDLPENHETIYFQVRAAADQDGAQHKAQINIWFKPDGSSDWISAYSEIRANYALIIPAVSTGTGD